jgi:hypothetical protein
VGQEDGLAVQLHMFGERIGIEVGLRSDVFEIGNVIDRDSFMRHVGKLETCPDCPMGGISGPSIKLTQITQTPDHPRQITWIFFRYEMTAARYNFR